MTDPEDLLTLVGEIVAAHVSNNSVATSDLPTLIKSVHAALASLGAEPAPAEPEKPKGAVSVRASIKPDGIISMIDGKKYQTLRRHLARHGYTPESYRATFGLPADYPLTSANYSELRRGMAKKIGLGRKAAVDPAPEPITAPAPKPIAALPDEAPKPKRGRKAAVTAVVAPPAAEAVPAGKKPGRPAKAKPQEASSTVSDAAAEG
jgi:predicted transcriptional regulator